jgi:DNA-binding transcriptional LysR family regulator
MNLRSIDLNLLVVFNAIIAEGNLTRAAEKIGMSQSAMCHALARLRTAMDHELFIRTAKGVEPTPAATQIADAVRTSLNLITETLDSTKAFNYADSHRKFRLALSDYGEMLILPKILQTLGKEAPNIEIEVAAPTNPFLREEFLSGKIDFVISHASIESDRVHSEEALSDSMVCVVRKGHPRARKKMFSLDEYLALEHVQLNLSHDEFSLIDDYLRERNYHRRRIHKASLYSMHALPWVINSSNLVGTVPLSLGKLFEKHFDLRMLESPFIFRST